LPAIFLTAHLASRIKAETRLRRRHHARRPPQAAIRPGRPVPMTGPGTAASGLSCTPGLKLSWKPVASKSGAK
jgi:hypothetical protein